jgi:hypothetical protein
MRSGDHPTETADASLVVFGSLARCEYTTGSDIDWTLLIDGQADRNHRHVGQVIKAKLSAEGYKGPSQTGPFGNLHFSHSMIHYIGGQRDTNQKLTRRILLLLESRAIGRSEAHDRVKRGVLGRYLEDSELAFSADGKEVQMPLFLLNDVVRFWRTLAVDYSEKRWQKQDRGWAVRNLKLRMSRKLILVSGLLICFSPRLGRGEGASPEEGPAATGGVPRAIGHFMPLLDLTPLEVVAKFAIRLERVALGCKLLTEYDSFLALLDDGACRTALEELPYKDAGSSNTFNDGRKLAREFQADLEGLFFDDTELGRLTRRYGLF